MGDIAPMFDWNDMRYFLALAEGGTLSAAARLLKVDHATVARHITGLERALGETLVDRLSKRWQLTQAGLDLVRLAEGMRTEAHSVERAVRARRESPSTTVTVSAPPALASHFLAPRFAELQARHPDLQVSLSGTQALASLNRQEADIAVRLWAPTEMSNVTRRIGKVIFGLYAAPDYSQLPSAQWRFIAYDDSLDHVPEQEWLRSFANGRAIAFRSNDLAGQLAAARMGMGIAALPRFLAETAAGVVALCDDSFSREIHLLTHRDMRRVRAIRIVMDFISEKVDADMPR
jgi:DNA-binding transcriptional LysR family regulator